MEPYTFGPGINDLRDFQATDQAHKLATPQDRDIKPNISRVGIVSGNYCKRNGIKCRFLLELDKTHYCGLTYDSERVGNKKMQEVVNYWKICGAVEKHKGFEL
jgi:hypothetical protein